MITRRASGIRAIALVVLSVIVPPSSSLHGQQMEAGTEAKRSVCEDHAALTHVGKTARERQTSIGMMVQRRCRAQAVAGLSRAWRAAFPEDVGVLATATSRIADRRLADTLEAVALADGLPRTVRLRALGVLVSYADPSAAVMFGDGSSPDPVRIGTRSHSSQQPGVWPLGDADRRGIVERLHRIATESPDTSVRAVASALAHQLAARFDAAAALKR